MLNKFAEELKEARIKNELSLQQIAARTRIDLKFLENLENGNFAFLPELYIKAFIREYAKLIGIDEKITLKKFDAAKRGKTYDEFGNTEDDTKKLKSEEVKQLKTQTDPSPNTPTFEAYDASNQQTESSSGLAKKKKMYIGIALGTVIIFVIVYFVFIKGSSEIIVAEKPYDQIQKENEERFTTESEKPAVNDSIFVGRTDSLSLVLKSNDASWIKILIDGTKSEEFTLFPNSHKEVKALNNYKMTVGNAGAVQFKLNNKPLNFHGDKHEVKYVAIDSSGLQYLTSSPNP
jgi:transcriptional regulator with XRE-family HTH domain